MDNKYGRQNIPEPVTPNNPLIKYWGQIQDVYRSDDLVIKLIEMSANTQSSLEYHVDKEEYYFLLKGKLKIGMRIGRAQNTSVVLQAGQLYHIPKGLMHMRIALEDCTILEWSNTDNDTDSNIVEDGKTYIHTETNIS